MRIATTARYSSAPITRTLPDDGLAVRCEDWTLPAEFPARYDQLESAMRAADELVKTQQDHKC